MTFLSADQLMVMANDVEQARLENLRREPNVWDKWYALGEQTRANLVKRHGNMIEAVAAVFGAP